MNNIASNLKLPLIISSALLVPFMVLQLANRRSFNEDFPFPLFVFMWLLSVAFIFIVVPIVRKLRTRKGAIANPLSLLLRVVLLIPIAWIWVAVVLDQMPCFLGVPNCD